MIKLQLALLLTVFVQYLPLAQAAFLLPKNERRLTKKELAQLKKDQELQQAMAILQQSACRVKTASKITSPMDMIHELVIHADQFGLQEEDLIVRNGSSPAPKVGTQRVPGFKAPKNKKKIRKNSLMARRLQQRIEIERNIDIATNPYDYLSGYSTESDASSVGTIDSLD